MKRIAISLVIALSLLVPTLRADNASEEQLREAAAYYLRQNSSLIRMTADQLTATRTWYNPATGEASMYLFSTPSDQMGWIIMAASTVMNPVIAYADDSDLPADSIPPQLEWWLDGFNSLVCEVQDADAGRHFDNSTEWNALTTKTYPTKDNERIYYLETKWDQGGKQGKDYNLLSPVVNGEYCPTGCVATAMAQICNYYRYPYKGKSLAVNTRNTGYTLRYNFKDSTIFNYDTMPDKIRNNTNYEQRYQVSRLAFAIGVAVKMQYDPEGSGATNPEAVSAMSVYFKYSQGTLVQRKSKADTAFYLGMRRELMKKHVLYMTGASSTGDDAHAAGHAWVCDGYQTENENYYHMNWGWGSTGNGWYNVGDNNMPIAGMGYNFTLYQAYIANMLPPDDTLKARFGEDVAIAPVENTTTLGMAYPNPSHTSISIPYAIRQSAELQVYSVDGRVVTTMQLQAGEGQATLNVSKMPAGIYIYRMGSQYGKFVVK